MSHLLQIGLIFFLGFAGAIAANKLGLPRVSGYIIVGMILAPSMTGIITPAFLKESTLIVDFSLSMVAFCLGGTLGLRNIMRHGRAITLITLGQAAGAYVFVSVAAFSLMGVWFGEFTMSDVVIMSLVFGALSLSTAPAATFATVHEYKASGTFTSTLLAVVALDDALGLMIFSLTLAFINTLINGGAHTLASLAHPLLSIFSSMAIGGILGLTLVIALRFINRKETLIITIVTFFTLSYGIAQTLHLEPLLCAMSVGMTVANLYEDNLPFRILEGNFEPVVLAIFFVLAGAHINLGVLLEYLPLAMIFVCFRIGGKVIGAVLGGKLAGESRAFSRNMGLALAPQAGIAIGLALYLSRLESFAPYAVITMNVILASTAVNEVLGPWLLKVSLHNVGEADRDTRD